MTALFATSAAVLGAGCGNSDDDDNKSTTGTDAGGGGSKGTTGGGSDSGGGGTVGTSDSGGGGGTTDSGTGATKDAGHGGTTPTTSTCTPANVLLGTEQTADIAAAASSNPFVNFLTTADLNNDGATDLIGADRTGLDIALSKKDGTFGTPTLVTDALNVLNDSIASGDFDGDGNQDILVESSTVEGSVDLLLGKGDGTFQAAKNTTIGSYNVFNLYPADFNGDGKLDFYYSAMNASGVVLNAGNGTFAGPGTSLDTINVGTVGDVNGDGSADIVNYNNDDTPQICVLLNTGTGSFGTPTCYASTNQSADYIRLGDLDGDGKLDIVALDYGADEGNGTGLNVFLGKGDGTFGASVGISSPDESDGLLVVDVNNDKLADVVITQDDDNSPSLNVYLSSATGTLATKPVVYAFGAATAYANITLVTGDFAGNGLTGFATPKDLSGNIDVITTTCKQ